MGYERDILVQDDDSVDPKLWGIKEYTRVWIILAMELSAVGNVRCGNCRLVSSPQKSSIINFNITNRLPIHLFSYSPTITAQVQVPSLSPIASFTGIKIQLEDTTSCVDKINGSRRKLVFAAFELRCVVPVVYPIDKNLFNICSNQ